MKKITALLLSCLMAVTTLTGCSPKYEKFSEMMITEHYFNTIISIVS